MVTYYPEDWEELEELWQPVLSESDLRLLRELGTVFDDAWLQRESSRLQAQRHCHHFYRWLIVPLTDRPIRQLALAEAIGVIRRAMAAGRMPEHQALLLRHLAAYSDSEKEYFSFFTREFEAITIGRFLKRESDRVSVEEIEGGSGKSNDILLRVDGQPVHVELKTLQRPDEELYLALATQALREAIHRRVRLSRGCEIGLDAIPDDSECEEIATALAGLDATAAPGARTVEVEAGTIHYDATAGPLRVSYNSSPQAAARRIRRVLKSAAAKAAGVDHPRVLFLKLYHFDRHDVQLATLREDLPHERNANLDAVVLLQNAPIQVGEVIIDDHMVVHNNHARVQLDQERLQLVLVAGL